MKKYFILAGGVGAALFLVLFSIRSVPVARASIAEEIEAKNKQIAELQKQIDEFQKQIEQTSSKAKTLNGEIVKMNSQINKIQLEIKSLSISISKTDSEITQTQVQITDAKSKLETHKKALAQYLTSLDEIDQTNLTEVMFNNNQISAYFNRVKNLQDIHEKVKDTIVAVKDLKTDLENKENDLEEKKNELQEMKALQQAQKQTLDQNKISKDKLLKATQGEEAKYKVLVTQTKRDLDKLRQEVSYLLQSGISIDDAVKYAQLAAVGAGIRPAFLLALLDTESRLGKNVGTGNWKTDMYDCYLALAKKNPSQRAFNEKRAETEKNAFFAVINKLGLDPNSVKVSARPSYGCGGAMGPAQFIPSTWLGYESEVIRITGHNPANPWNFQDAFTAAAVKLGRGGATSKTRAGEIAAAKAYISGNGNCSRDICNSYANTIQNKASAIEQSLGDKI